MAVDTSQQAYNEFTASALPGPGQSLPTYEQWVQQQNAAETQKQQYLSQYGQPSVSGTQGLLGGSNAMSAGGNESGVMANGATPYTETMTPQQIAILREALTNQNAASASDPISSLYQSVLGRAPDAGGLAYWNQQLANGVPLATIQQQFQASPEANKNTAATNTSTASTASDPISGLYQSVLGRAPDAGGKAYWQSQLNSGKSLQAIQAEMQASPEAKTRQSTVANKTTNPYGITTGNQFSNSTNPYVQAAQQTALGNLAGAQTATATNRVNQSTPYSNLQYTQTGVDAQGNPIWSANQTLAGPLQGALGSLSQGVANQASQGFNPNTPSVGINPGETYSDAIMRRLQPQMAQAKEQQDAQLANQGIVPGTQAYENAMRTFQQGQNDQLTSAITGGFGVGLQANNQSFNQQLQQANLPIAQLGAFNQATQPGYVNPYNQAATGGPDYTGSYATSQAAALAAQNAANAKTANTQSGLYSLGGAALLGGGGVGGLFNLGSQAVNGISNAYNWITTPSDAGTNSASVLSGGLGGGGVDSLWKP